MATPTDGVQRPDGAVPYIGDRRHQRRKRPSEQDERDSDRDDDDHKSSEVGHAKPAPADKSDGRRVDVHVTGRDQPTGQLLLASRRSRTLH